MDMYVQSMSDHMKKISYDDIEAQIANYNGNDTQVLMTNFETLEYRIGCLDHAADMVKAGLCILSGKVLLRAKELVGHGNWNTVAYKMFPLSEKERNIRMKEASIANIEQFINLGWKRIAILTTTCKVSKTNIPFQTIIKSINYTLKLKDPADLEFFHFLVEAYVVWNSLGSSLKQKIQFTQIVDAVEMGVVFDKKLIKRLSQSSLPSTTLNNLIYAGTANVTFKPSNENPTMRVRELAKCLHKINGIGKLIVNFQDNYLKHIPLELLSNTHETLARLMSLKGV